MAHPPFSLCSCDVVEQAHINKFKGVFGFLSPCELLQPVVQSPDSRSYRTFWSKLLACELNSLAMRYLPYGFDQVNFLYDFNLFTSKSLFFTIITLTFQKKMESASSLTVSPDVLPGRFLSRILFICSYFVSLKQYLQ